MTGADRHPDPLRIAQPPPTLREMALERLREAIIGGGFEPGDRLVERQRCDLLGVSRSVVREVIRHLESEGLVETVANHGPVVARIDWNTARQIYEVRALLESTAAAACAQNATPEVLATLERALSDIETALANGEAAAGRGDNTAGGTGGCGAALPPARRPGARARCVTGSLRAGGRDGRSRARPPPRGLRVLLPRAVPGPRSGG